MPHYRFQVLEKARGKEKTKQYQKKGKGRTQMEDVDMSKGSRLEGAGAPIGVSEALYSVSSVCEIAANPAFSSLLSQA